MFVRLLHDSVVRPLSHLSPAPPRRQQHVLPSAKQCAVAQSDVLQQLKQDACYRRSKCYNVIVVVHPPPPLSPLYCPLPPLAPLVVVLLLVFGSCCCCCCDSNAFLILRPARSQQRQTDRERKGERQLPVACFVSFMAFTGLFLAQHVSGGRGKGAVQHTALMCT